MTVDGSRSYGLLPVLILGAGIAGLGAARGLTSRGHRIIVIDAAQEIGGMHRSRVYGPYSYDVGSIFYEEDALIFRVFPGLREKCPVVLRVERRIDPSGRLRMHPLDPREIRSQPLPRRLSSVADLAWHQLFYRPDGSALGAYVGRLGRRIYEDTGVDNYIRRFNRVDPARVDQEFFNRRAIYQSRNAQVQRLLPEILRGLVPRSAPALLDGNYLRVRPSEGFEALFDPVRRMLEASNVSFELGAPIRHIRREGDGFVVTTDRAEFRGASVVNAMPLDTCHHAVYGTPSGLQSLDILTIFVSARNVPQDFGNVLYNFHGRGDWKRATIYSRLYPGLGAGREFLSVERTLAPGTQADPAAALADFARHLEDLGFALHDLRLEGHEVIDAAYPLHLKGEANAAAAVLKKLEDFGIVSVGRQGRFEYLPTATGVLRRVNEELALAAARQQLSLSRASARIGAGLRE